MKSDKHCSSERLHVEPMRSATAAILWNAAPPLIIAAMSVDARMRCEGDWAEKLSLPHWGNA